MTDSDDKIRERAYSIWQAQGEPAGDHLRHWEQASREIAQAQTSAQPKRRKNSAVAVQASHQAEKPARTRKANAAAPRPARKSARAKAAPEA